MSKCTFDKQKNSKFIIVHYFYMRSAQVLQNNNYIHHVILI